MKEIIIEEVISQTFHVPDDTTYEDVRKMYQEEKLVLENPSLTQVNCLMENDGDWIDLHIN